VTDENLVEVAALTALEELSLHRCEQVTDRGLAALARGAGAGGLKHLDLWGCSLVSDAGVAQLAHCKVRGRAGLNLMVARA
jgi:hypothetical protein